MKENDKLGLSMLVLIGMGSMIGGGIFNSPTDLINLANPQSVVIAWIIGGIGIIALAMVFNMLANKKPELTGGIYTYAKEGFGDFAGFNSAWGYWISAWLGNVAFIVLLVKTIADLVGGMSAIVSFVFATVLLWAVYLLQIRGTKNTSIINSIVTIAKLIPIVLAILLGVFIFKRDIFFVSNWKNTLAATGGTTSLLKQISGSMGTILWSFVGIEAAVVLSERAESQKIVGKAIIVSIIATLAIYMFITIVSMGAIQANSLSKSITPFADLLGKTVIGKSGSIIAKLGLIISLVGAFISWVMLAAETPYLVAKSGSMPKWLGKLDKNDVPRNSLMITTILTQIFLFSLLSGAFQKAYSMLYNIATTSILIPYFFSAIYGAKVALEEEKFTGLDKFIAIIATIYTIYVIYAVGILYLGLTVILYALGIYVYIKAKKENGKEITSGEKIWISIILIISVLMIIGLATGRVAI